MEPIPKPPSLYTNQEAKPQPDLADKEKNELHFSTLNAKSLKEQAYIIQSKIQNELIIHYQKNIPTSDVSPLANLHLFDTIILGELHNNHKHAELNAEIVDYLWNCHKNELLLLTEDGFKNSDSQVRFVKSNVKTQRWDTPLAHVTNAKEELLNKIDLCMKFAYEKQKMIVELQKMPRPSSQEIKVLSEKLITKNNNCIELNKSLLDRAMNYRQIVISSCDERDVLLQREVTKLRKTDPHKKIVIISGNDHIKPFAKFLENKNLNGLALGIDTSDVNSEKAVDGDFNEFDFDDPVKTIEKQLNMLSTMILKSNLDEFKKAHKVGFVLIMQKNFLLSVYENIQSVK